MVDGIYKIATSKDHWGSPFVYQKDAHSCYLTTREKVIAVALAILTLPFAVITFYLVTAFFKDKDCVS